MSCAPSVLREVPLFSKLDDDEMNVLASQVELRRFAARHRIYRIGDAGERAYVMVSGARPGDHRGRRPAGRPRGRAGARAVLRLRVHAREDAASDQRRGAGRDGLRRGRSARTSSTLLQQKPHAGMDMLSVLGPPDSRGPAARARARRAKPERDHRSRVDVRRADRRRRGRASAARGRSSSRFSAF